eukprot:GHVT01072627.1.p3 GENE.GHVT01072627.1~~GHVT01072627.1.p3  ORF type:complete len:121 (-),score=26.34 GHVT01072627.1:969-1331(-)
MARAAPGGTFTRFRVFCYLFEFLGDEALVRLATTAKSTKAAVAVYFKRNLVKLQIHQTPAITDMFFCTYTETQTVQEGQEITTTTGKKKRRKRKSKRKKRRRSARRRRSSSTRTFLVRVC